MKEVIEKMHKNRGDGAESGAAKTRKPKLHFLRNHRGVAAAATAADGRHTLGNIH